MIKRIFVDNYKCLVNFELQLDSLSLLIGANGVGKSAILDVLTALRHLLGGSRKVLDPGVFPASTRTRWQSVPLQVIELDVDLEGTSYRYRLEVDHDPESRKARIRSERLTTGGRPLFTFEMGDAQLYRDDHSEGPKFPADWSESALARVAPRPENKRLTAFLELMRARLIVCSLDPRTFTAESGSENPILARDGSNFADWYRHVLLERQDLVPEFLQELRNVIADLSSISLERVGTDARAMMLIFRAAHSSNGGRYELRLDELSDGQRALVALYALIHLTADQGYSLFLDEPDNYVALAELQPWLAQLSGACGGALRQAVVCSHHPELIDYLGPEHGLLLAREVTGSTTVTKLGNIEMGSALRPSEVLARGWQP